MSGKGIVLIFGVFMLAAAIVPLWFVATAKERVGLASGAKQLETVMEVALDHAAATGTYPAHIAMLMAETDLNRESVVDPRGLTDSVWTVGDTPIDDLNWQPERIEAASQSMTRPYRFGDYWFAGHAEPTGKGDILFAWTSPAFDGLRFAIFDDERVRRLEAADWEKTVERDRTARKRLGI